MTAASPAHAMRLPARAGAAVLVLVLVSPRARADAAHAAERYRAAEDAYAHGAFRAAADGFEDAFHEDPRGASAYNAGLSWEAVGDLPRAADAYAVALTTADLGISQRADSRKRLSALEAKLGVVVIQGPPNAKAWVAHAENISLPARVHLMPGSYSVRVRFADGRDQSRTATTAAGSVTTAEFVAAPEPEARPFESPRPGRPTATTRGSPLRTAGWVSLAVAAAWTGATVAFGMEALSARSTFEATGDTSQPDHDRAVTFRTLSDVGVVAAGVSLTAGIVLLVAAPGTGTEIHASPTGAAFQARF